MRYLGTVSTKKDQRRRMSKQKKAESGEHAAGNSPGPGSETERFRAITDVKHNEAVTGESGVPAKMREHEQRCQKRSLDEFS
jgi:hypothetical protein